MGEETALPGWDAVDATDEPETFRSYLDAVTGRERMRALKRRSYRLLDPTAGDRLLDVGCGTGDDALALADEVGPGGSVVGVDNSAAMVEEARERASASTAAAVDADAGRESEAATVSFRVADAESLPFADGRFDGARVDRVLQHLERPREAFAELRRVTRPGGRVVATDTDWGTLVVDAPEDVPGELSSRILDPTWSCARDGRIGRRLRRWAVEAGLGDLDLDTATLVLTDFDAGDEVLGLTGRVERMREAGALEDDEAARWLGGLRAADEAGSFFASLTLYTAAGTVPEPGRSA
ncbi:methyltransferase domain-containing protein [Halorussus salilacus]|uniref:methyltransferase domain-containing protein n=1 Tax=Halorussus salilacus TaxID=2953750 RepID=UPI0020A1AA2B|nr:methyltransferase domain-containing protein [Halorussus salilacus]USZ67756.1 methyltransferase domain-containing protein [Halorussus salilacus]